jgi:hypothetical protein
LAENDLTLERFNALMRDEILIGRTRVFIDREVIACLPDHLRAMGQYASLAALARNKQQVLEAQGLDNPGLQDIGLTEDELLRWYYGRLRRAVPRDLTNAAYEAGFESTDALRFALIREFCFLRATQPDTLWSDSVGGDPVGDA